MFIRKDIHSFKRDFQKQIRTKDIEEKINFNPIALQTYAVYCKMCTKKHIIIAIINAIKGACKRDSCASETPHVRM